MTDRERHACSGACMCFAVGTCTCDYCTRVRTHVDPLVTDERTGYEAPRTIETIHLDDEARHAIGRTFISEALSESLRRGRSVGIYYPGRPR